jgi:hypothetical protein
MFAKFRKFLEWDGYGMMACSSCCEAFVVSVIGASTGRGIRCLEAREVEKMR